VHYLAIAEHGYELFSCARLPGYDPSHTCGNAGWLPGFPLLIRALHALGADPVSAGAFVAALFALATLVLIWNAFLGAKLSPRPLLVLLLAGFFPGHVYAHAVFPVSMCAFFQVAALHAHAAKRAVWAGLLGAVAAFSYGSGLFLAGVFGLDLLASAFKEGRREPWSSRLWRIVVEPGLVATGFALALFVQWLDLGVWNGYFAVQAKYGYGPTPPWESLSPHVRALLSGRPAPTHIQALFVVGLLACLLWGAWKLPRHARDRVLALFSFVYWILPLSLGGKLSLYRADAVLLPGVPLARKLPLPVLGALLLAAFVISFGMALLFFRNRLV
jgi:hypothetical protein